MGKLIFLILFLKKICFLIYFAYLISFYLTQKPKPLGWLGLGHVHNLPPSPLSIQPQALISLGLLSTSESGSLRENRPRLIKMTSDRFSLSGEPILLKFKLKEDGYEVSFDNPKQIGVAKISSLPTWEEMKETIKFILPPEEFILVWRGNRNGGQITAIPISR